MSRPGTTGGLVPLALLLLLSACRANPPPGGRAVPTGLAPGFGAMDLALRKASAAATRKDAAALRALGPDLVDTGIGLLRARLPHDLRDADVPRFLEARLSFGDALKDWATAAQGRDDAALLAAFDRLADAYYGWMDVYKGRAPERSV